MSKKYKTSEAIAMLEKNPELKFKAKTMNGYPKTLYYDNGIKCSQFAKDANKYEDSHNISIYLDDEWELKQQPVSFMEAIKAYSEGKTIRCEYDEYYTRTYKPRSSEYCQIESTDKDYLSLKEIIDGKWYVEENNE